MSDFQNEKKSSDHLHAVDSDSSNPHSLATNYISPSVNTRTGQLTVNVSAPQLPGINSINIDLGITYTQRDFSDNRSVLGLPNNWYFPLSYIANDTIYVNAAQSYQLNPDSPTGLKYYDIRDFVLTTFDFASLPSFPYDPSQQYAYLLSSLSGNKQYFDGYGRLIGAADKFGNHVLYYYDQQNSDVYNCRLDHIIDTYGQTISFVYTENTIQVVFPSGGKNQISFTYTTQAGNTQLKSFTDPAGDIISFQYNGGLVRTDLISLITYPNQLQLSFGYSTIYYKNAQGNALQLDVVQSMTGTYESSAIVTTYDYNPDDGGGENYLGFPDCQNLGGRDVLFESNLNNYRYKCRKDDGIFLTTYVYNHLHLLLEKHRVAKQDGAKITDFTYTYSGQYTDGSFPPAGLLPANYQSLVKKETTFYNSKGESRKEKTETAYNDSLQITNAKQFEWITAESQFALSAEARTVYDPAFGMMISKTEFDYKSTGIITSQPSITQIFNTLSPDGKMPITNQLGTVVIQNDQEVFSPEKRNTLSYDNQGRITSKTMAWDAGATSQPGVVSSGYTMTYVFDPANCELTTTKIDDKGYASSQVIDTTNGFLPSKQNAVNAIARYTYDNLGRELTRVDPIGITATWVYEINLNKVTKKLSTGYKTYTYYDGFGNILRKSDNAGSDPTKERTIETRAFDFANRMKSRSGILGEKSKVSYGFASTGMLNSTTDALGNVLTCEYDSVNRIKTTWYNGLKSQEQQYDTNKKITLTEQYSSINEASVSVEKRYDNNKLKVFSQNGQQLKDVNWSSVTSVYDISKKLISSSNTGWDGVSRNKNISRDLFAKAVQCITTLTLPEKETLSATTSLLLSNHTGWLEQETNPLNQVRKYKYDAAGNNIKHIHFDGTEVDFSYYPNNKLKTTSYTDVDGSKQVLNYTYWDGINLVKTIGSKRDGTIAYDYTPDGKINSITYPDGKILGFGYDPDKNQLTSFTDITGNSTIYSYDDYGRLQQITVRGFTVKYAYYDIQTDKANSGQLHTITFSTGIVVTYSYNGFSQLEIVAVSNAEKANVLTVKYTYDEISRMLNSVSRSSSVMTDLDANYCTTYTYNSLGKLINELTCDNSNKQISTINYSYDAADNVLTKQSTVAGKQSSITYTYDLDNKLTSYVEDGITVTLGYDVNGNMKEDGLGNTYLYNPLNQLISFTDKTGIKTVYTYYPNGLRHSKQVGSGLPVIYYYDNSKVPNIVNEMQGATTAGYLLGKGMRHLRFVQSGDDVKTEVMIQGAKNVLLILDTDGNPSRTYNYDPYGMRRSFDMPLKPESFSIADNPFRYSSEYHDAESGLDYLRSRYYSPKLMRFINRDSIQINNHYNYTNGNPVMLNDPSGHSPWWSWLLFGLSLIVTVVVTVFSFGTATGAVVAADAIELGAMSADAAATVGDTAADVAGETAEGMTNGLSGYGSDVEAMDISSESESDISESEDEEEEQEQPPNNRYTKPRSFYNPSGDNINCPYTCAGKVLNMPATEVAESVGTVEGPLKDFQTLALFKELGICATANPDFVTMDATEAFDFMAESDAGDQFALRYNSFENWGHWINARSLGGDVEFFDAQADAAVDEMPTAANPGNPNLGYFIVVRLYNAMEEDVESLPDLFGRGTMPH